MQVFIDIVQNFLDGIMVGSSYALLGLGFALIFGVMRRVNLAYGSTILIGVFAMKPLKWGVVSTAKIGLEKVLPAMARSPDGNDTLPKVDLAVLRRRSGAGCKADIATCRYLQSVFTKPRFARRNKLFR